MKRLLVMLYLLCTIISCSNNESKNVETTVKKDTLLDKQIVAINDTNVIANPLMLSENEMKDDSVFADGSIPTSWANAGITDVKGLKLFLKQAQQWVMNNDKEKLAAAVR
ncbi:MAG: hypothetical protein EOO03_06470, partial [Chitinophagaceae bacterium]